MERYYEIIIRMIVSSDKGDKAVNQSYLVRAMSVTEAEIKMNEDMKDYPNDWEVKSIKETKIEKVIE